MNIAPGKTLGKYELCEKVGQGGMAVVYRGIDSSLGRNVAIKVLHQHLADSPEARARFEREARTVAKVRHENILEIYDFSGASSDQNYIVTEFIDGQTLREFLASHQPAFPEIGAMVTVQVCRALSQAHRFGILHRDVKPENIMIRDDGIVKLTDFGIAQMLDTQRMTVTGQLLGSPAYMSPEHIEGEQLDFRTDIFAAGVVLYQLAVGELPFQGRNAHELLKRIAEGKYRDPRQVNPLVGNQLAAIINKAIARDKDQRFSDTTEMLDALLKYLEISDLRNYRAELARYFAAPGPYEVAFRERILHALTQRGKALMDTQPIVAMDLFNRVLSIEPEHEEVLHLIDRLSRRSRLGKWMAAFVGCAIIAALAYGGIAVFAPAILAPAPVQKLPLAPVLAATAGDRGQGGDADAKRALDRAIAALRQTAPAAPETRTAPALPQGTVPSPSGTGPANPQANAQAPADARQLSNRPGRDRPSIPVMRSSARRTSRPMPVTPASAPTASSMPAGQASITESPQDSEEATERRRYLLNVSPFRSEFRVDKGPWQAIADSRARIEIGPGRHVVEVRNPRCCEAEEQVIAADDGGDKTLSFSLGYLPAAITPRCSRPGVAVSIDQRPAQLGRKRPIPIRSNLGRQDVTVTFFAQGQTDSQTASSGQIDEQVVRVRYNDAKIITCAFE